MAILVTYSSKHGATRGIAERIAARLNKRGLPTDIHPMTEVGDPGAWSAVVLGSAVYMGSWMHVATQFVHRHHEVLAGRPVWLFSSGPVGDKPQPLPKEIAEFESEIHPRGHEVFAGCLDRDTLSVGERLMIKAVKAPYGDFRDWVAIDRWADGIVDKLNAGVAPAATEPRELVAPLSGGR